MAIPNFAFVTALMIDTVDTVVGTATFTFHLTMFNAGQQIEEQVETAPFAVSGGIVALDGAVLDAVQARYAARFNNAVLARTSVVIPQHKFGS